MISPNDPLRDKQRGGVGALLPHIKPTWERLIEPSWFGALIAAILLWFLAGYVTGNLSLSFLAANATIAGFLAVAGTAQMVVIASGPGNFDLSLPYLITFGAYVMSAGFLGPDNIIGSLGLTLLVGSVAGLLNAALVIKLRIPAVIATLATGYIIYTLIVAVQNAGFGRVGGFFEQLMRMRAGGISGALVMSVVTLVFLGILLLRTVYGVQLHALGQNNEAARLAGIRRDRMLATTFIICGVGATWLGALLAAYQGGISADLGRAYLLGSVAAVVVGGTRITGGVTSVIGTALGALVLTLAMTDLILMKFSIGAQYLMQGLIVIGTVCLSTIRSSRRT
jgi:ribose transport system permease protein